MNTQNPQNQQLLLMFLKNGQIPARWFVFAKSLCSQKRLTPKQLSWVDKIVADVLNPPAPKAPDAVVNVKNIVNLFDNAKKHLKFPKVNLQIKPNMPLRCSLAGKNSKNAGSIMLSAGSFGSTFYGSIKPTGELWLTREATAIKPELTKLLQDFANDPAKVAADHGKLTSHCCFCHLPLSTPESLAVGYGDTCAEHFHLPWGEDKKSSATILKTIKDEVDANNAPSELAKMNYDYDDEYVPNPEDYFS